MRAPELRIFIQQLRSVSAIHHLHESIRRGWAQLQKLIWYPLMHPSPHAGRDSGSSIVRLAKLSHPLRAQAGVALTMILHELATNAAKYGALSTPHGTLDVNWQREDSGGRPQIRLRWIEAGGPPVKTPSRRGFGSELIERSTTHELHGQAILDYREEGLHGELTFPWDESSPPGGSEG